MPLSEACAETQEPDGVSLTRARAVKREGRRARGMCADPWVRRRTSVPPYVWRWRAVCRFVLACQVHSVTTSVMCLYHG